MYIFKFSVRHVPRAPSVTDVSTEVGEPLRLGATDDTAVHGRSCDHVFRLTARFLLSLKRRDTRIREFPTADSFHPTLHHQHRPYLKMSPFISLTTLSVLLLTGFDLVSTILGPFYIHHVKINYVHVEIKWF